MSPSLAVDLNATVYALDSTTIDRASSACTWHFPWAPFRSTKAAVKLHTLLDLRGNIPSFIHTSDGKLHDVNVLDLLIPEAGAYNAAATGFHRRFRARVLQPAEFVHELTGQQ